MTWRELGPCIICRQKLSAPRNEAWKIDSRFSRIEEVDERQPLRLADGNETGAMFNRTKDAKDETELFHVDCSRCKSSSFVMIVPGPFHAKAIIQTLTDLTKNDLTRMSELKEIDSNEVLTFYLELRNGGK